jgi:hypothetical protein
VLGVSASGRDAGCGWENWEVVVLKIMFDVGIFVVVLFF